MFANIMNNNYITFELPAQPLTKISLYLETLAHVMLDAVHETHPYIHHYAIQNILEIIKVIEKPEIKSRFLKEFIRIAHTLEKTEYEGGELWLKDINHHIYLLNQSTGRLGEHLIQDPFLQGIRPLQTTLTSECELRSPKLTYWLGESSELRQEDLKRWVGALELLYKSVNLYLNLLRNALVFEEIDTRIGFYQRSIPSRKTCQLIQVKIPKTYGYVPRMNLGQHGFSMRLEAFSRNNSAISDGALICEVGISSI